MSEEVLTWSPFSLLSHLLGWEPSRILLKGLFSAVSVGAWGKDLANIEVFSMCRENSGTLSFQYMQALGKLPKHTHTHTHTVLPTLPKTTLVHWTPAQVEQNSSGGWRVCVGGRWVLRQCWKEEGEMFTVFYLNFCDMIQRYLSKPFSSIQSLSCVQLCNPMGHSMPGFPVHHQLLELAQTHVH